MRDYFVYILASGRNGTLYVGVTNDLGRRLGEHKEKLVAGFTRRHGVDILVWCHRARKADQGLEPRLVRLIEKTNPVWNDLAKGLM